MSWFSNLSSAAITSKLQSGLAEAQKRATEAADKAKELAQQASAQARVLAEQATTQAKVLAEKAAEEAQQVQQRLNQLAVNVQQSSASSGSGATADPAELAEYGITNELTEFVGGLTYSTFSDCNVDSIASTNPLGLAPGSPLRLSAWQERHAVLVLQAVNQLQHLRFALCPKRMTDEQFWLVYFYLCKKLQPPQAFGLPPAAPAAGSSSPSSSAAAATGSNAAASRSASGSLAPSSSAATPLRTPGAASSTPARRSAAGSSAAAETGAGGSAAGAALQGSSQELRGESSSSKPAAAADASELDGSHDEGGDVDADVDDLHLDDHVSFDGDEDDLDKLAELENDPELAAYLQEALNVDDEDGLSGAGSGIDDGDLDDYINQLDAELGADSVSATPSKVPPPAEE